MTTIRATAPAKVNLTLHVTGQRDDGYHLLDSLVVFADVGDELTVTSAPDLTLSLSGPGTENVPADDTNLVMQAARALQAVHGIDAGASIALHKYLPTAAGLGGGSSDAATAIKLLSQLWGVTPLSNDSPAALELGADVPVCLRGPGPMRMTGIGEVLADVTDLPDAALVLVNPRVTVPTGAVFGGLQTKINRSMRPIPPGIDFDEFAEWLAQQRNDLLPSALEVAPVIQQTLDKLNSMPQVAFASMSGSGATCFGLVRNMSDARFVARALQLAFGDWWVAPAQILK